MNETSISVNAISSTETAELSDAVRSKIDFWLARYPEDQKQSAVIAALHAAQQENKGYLTTPIMNAVAVYLDMSNIAVYEVASFYSMFETKPVGEHCVAVCTNISCMLKGGYDLLHHLEDKLGIKVGESTPDGKFYLKKEEECLAACAGAPMMQVNHIYFENLTHEKADEIIDNVETMAVHHG